MEREDLLREPEKNASSDLDAGTALWERGEQFGGWKEDRATSGTLDAD